MCVSQFYLLLKQMTYKEQYKCLLFCCSWCMKTGFIFPHFQLFYQESEHINLTGNTEGKLPPAACE